jgi:putative peptide zinc metalloprotease protein
MLVKDNITIVAVDNNWVIQNQEGRNFLVNEYAKKLFEILQSKMCLEEALIDFNILFQTTYDKNQFKDLVANSLGGYDILNNDEVEKKQSLKNRYLELKLQVIPPQIAGIMSRPFQFLYEPTLFWTLFTLLVAINLFFIRTQKIELKFTNYTVVTFLAYSSILIHELGHIGACAKSKLKHGGIGIGIYFIFPVMYADITNIWLANRHNRVIANLAGIFNELLYAFLLFLLAWLTKNNSLMLSGVIISTMTVFELNPFGRLDGYWVLSDLSNTPNLLGKSQKLTQQFIKNILNFKFEYYSLKEVLFIIYGFLNFSLLLFFMRYLLINQRESILAFPVNVFKILANMMKGNFDFEIIDKTFIMILTFYAFSFSVGFRIIIKNIPIWLKKMHQIEVVKSIFKTINK